MALSSNAGPATYGLVAPTAADLRTAVLRVFGDDGEQIWGALLTGLGSASRTVDDLITAMCASENRLLALCGRSQHIRLASHRQLAPSSSVRPG